MLKLLRVVQIGHLLQRLYLCVCCHVMNGVALREKITPPSESNAQTIPACHRVQLAGTNGSK